MSLAEALGVVQEAKKSNTRGAERAMTDIISERDELPREPERHAEPGLSPRLAAIEEAQSPKREPSPEVVEIAPDPSRHLLSKWLSLLGLESYEAAFVEEGVQHLARMRSLEEAELTRAETTRPI